MDNFKINKFAKEIVKSNAIDSLLNSITSEVEKQKGFRSIFSSCTFINELDKDRVVLYRIPDTKEALSIENNIIKIVKQTNKYNKQ